MRQTTNYPRTTTIVTKSSRAVAMLAEGQEQLGQMGIKIDLDATAQIFHPFILKMELMER